MFGLYLVSKTVINHFHLQWEDHYRVLNYCEIIVNHKKQFHPMMETMKICHSQSLSQDLTQRINHFGIKQNQISCINNCGLIKPYDDFVCQM